MLVLLGEPGIGKTTVFKRLTAQGSGHESRVALIDAANVTEATFDEELGELLSK